MKESKKTFYIILILGSILLLTNIIIKSKRDNPNKSTKFALSLDIIVFLLLILNSILNHNIIEYRFDRKEDNLRILVFLLVLFNLLSILTDSYLINEYDDGYKKIRYYVDKVNVLFAIILFILFLSAYYSVIVYYPKKKPKFKKYDFPQPYRAFYNMSKLFWIVLLVYLLFIVVIETELFGFF